MELRHLRYFVLLAEELHFARAADRLGISQPPLSQQIRALEEELGVRLLARTSRRVALTPAGTLFLEAARRTLDEAELAIAVARRAASGELGTLRVGFNASAPFIPSVAAAIHHYRQTYPDVGLLLKEVAGPAQIEAIVSRSLDIGFLRTPRPPVLPATLTASLLLEDRLFVGMRPDHRLAAGDGVRWAQLAGEPLVVYASDRSGGFSEHVFRLMRDAGVEPEVAQSVQEISTLFGLTAAGVGVTIIAGSLRAMQSAGLVYRPVVDAGAVSSMWMVRRRDDDQPTCANFLALMDGATAA
ncbi:MAG: LysR substrate-binding domain-containing protein [Janthinobacterium lividum]